MKDFVAAIGLVLVIEGILAAAFPAALKAAMVAAVEAPFPKMRFVGIASAVLGVFFVWMVRG